MCIVRKYRGRSLMRERSIDCAERDVGAATGYGIMTSQLIEVLPRIEITAEIMWVGLVVLPTLEAGF